VSGGDEGWGQGAWGLGAGARGWSGHVPSSSAGPGGRPKPVRERAPSGHDRSRGRCKELVVLDCFR
jgi:hypothetical protein